MGKFQLLVSYLQNCESQQWKLLPQLLTKSVNLQQYQNQLAIIQQQVKDDLLTSSDVALLFLEWKDESFTVYIDTDHLTRPERSLLDLLKSLSASSVFLNTETTTMSSMIAAAEKELRLENLLKYVDAPETGRRLLFVFSPVGGLKSFRDPHPYDIPPGREEADDPTCPDIEESTESDTEGGESVGKRIKREAQINFQQAAK